MCALPSVSYLDMPLHTREEAYAVAIYRFPIVFFPMNHLAILPTWPYYIQGPYIKFYKSNTILFHYCLYMYSAC